MRSQSQKIRSDNAQFQDPRRSRATAASAAYREHCEAVVSILPMQGEATSHNVTSAASILLYEIGRQRILGASRPAGPEVRQCPSRAISD